MAEKNKIFLEKKQTKIRKYAKIYKDKYDSKYIESMENTHLVTFFFS